MSQTELTSEGLYVRYAPKWLSCWSPIDNPE